MSIAFIGGVVTAVAVSLLLSSRSRKKDRQPDKSQQNSKETYNRGV